LERLSEVKGIAKYALCLMFFFAASATRAQVQVGDDLTMRMNGLLSLGYSADYGDQIPSDHNLNLGGDATVNGDYYSPNFLNFTASPYYNRSSANSSFSSLTNSSGVNAMVNLFSGSRFPGYVSYNYTYNNTSSLGLIGNPNFTIIGTGQGFGIGWSALLPNWPTFSVSYSDGSGSGNVFGTHEESSSDTKTLNLRSSYRLAGWNLNALYTHLDIDSRIPFFLSGENGKDVYSSTGNDLGINASHQLPWHGMVTMAYERSSYDGDFDSFVSGGTAEATNYTTDSETANVQFHPTNKLGLFASQQYIDNLNGYFYQNIINTGGGVPIQPQNSQSNSSTLAGGVSYNFRPDLFGQGQITYYSQNYLGHSYDGSYLTATLGYSKRILHIFGVSATVIDSTNKFANNALGFIGNVNAFHYFGPWQTSGNFSYAQNVQTLLVTYTMSYYNYSGNIHRRWGRTMQWTGAFAGSHSGFTNQAGTDNHAESYSTSLSLRRLSLNGNYTESRGQSILTSTGIQPIPPTPGLLPEGLIVYNGKSYSAAITVTPIPRLFLTGTYSHAASDTQSNDVLSFNKTNIFYGQLQYRLRRISVLGGFTKFSQGISAAGLGTGNEYSYYIGVQRWFTFF
jgi:hypothetical protein